MAKGWNQNIDSNQKAECPSLAFFYCITTRAQSNLTTTSLKKYTPYLVYLYLKKSVITGKNTIPGY
jgi:hypothetical protein